MTIGSLFSGIGGLELGLERAGLGPVIWQAESDDHCRRVLAKHWPGMKCFEDVREVDEHAERPDIICGGFPCQDISTAGARAGIDGERSGLWAEFARIIRVLRPRVVVVENVRALTVRGLDRVLGDLASIGYDAEWDCVSAAAVGAPHIRDRIFIIAHPSGQGPQGDRVRGATGDGGGSRDVADAQELAERPRLRQGEPGGVGGRRSGDGGGEGKLADANGGGCKGSNEICRGESVPHGRCRDGGRPTRANPNADGRGREVERVAESGGVSGPRRGEPDRLRQHRRLFDPPGRRDDWEVEPNVGRVVDGLSHGMDSHQKKARKLAGYKRPDRLRALGNAVVPQVAEHIGRCIVEAGLGTA